MRSNFYTLVLYLESFDKKYFRVLIDDVVVDPLLTVGFHV